MHDVAKHGLKHIAHAYIPATNCPFQNNKLVLPVAKVFFTPARIGYSKEIAKVLEFARRNAKACEFRHGFQNVRKGGQFLFQAT